MVPQSGPLLLVIVVAGLWQWDVGLGCYGDIGRPAAQGGVPPRAAHKVAGYSPFDAPPQTGPRGGLDFEGLDSCGEEGSLGTPGEGKKNGYCRIWNQSGQKPCACLIYSRTHTTCYKVDTCTPGYNTIITCIIPGNHTGTFS